MTRCDQLRLLLVDDHPPIREAVRRRLDADPRFKVVGEAGDIRGALARLAETRPDLAVIDIGLGQASGLFVAREIRDRHPCTRVVIWSMHDNARYVAAAKKAGARGYVLKSGPTGEIVKALEVVAGGGCYYSVDVDRTSVPDPEPTPREMQVLRLVASGMPSSKIAKQLGVDCRTVETHRRNIMAKLGATNTADLIMIAVGLGLLDVHDFID